MKHILSFKKTHNLLYHLKDELWQHFIPTVAHILSFWKTFTSEIEMAAWPFEATEPETCYIPLP